MKFSNKIKLSLSLGILSVLSFTSCSMVFKDNSEKIRSSYVCIDYDLTKDNLTSFDNARKKTLYYIENDGTILRNSFISSFNTAYIGLIEIRRAYTIEYLSYSMKGYSENQEKYLYLQEKFTESIKWLNSFYKKVYNSNYKDIFFEKYTEEEIEDLINREKSDKYYQLSNEKAQLEAEYSALSQSEMISRGSYYITSLINLNHEFVKELDYDNYIKYSYKEEYNREYDYHLTLDYAKYVKNYIFDYASNLNNVYKEEYDNAKNTNSKQYQTYLLMTEKLNDNNKQYVSDYIDYMSQNNTWFLNNFNNLKYGKNVFLGEFEGSYQGAYTTLLFSVDYEKYDVNINPFMYFGSRYFDPSTFLHEFGHYSHFTLSSSMPSYDLAETQSQADEALFWNYLVLKNDLGDDAKLYCNYQLLDGLRIIILASMVNSFEIKAYEKEDLKEEDIDLLIDEVCEEYNGFESVFDGTKLDYDVYNTDGSLKQDAKTTVRNYIKRVCVTSSLYYISYSTSFLSTLNIYNEALNDFDSAKDKYMLLLKEDGDIVEAMEKVGFTSPFDEETFKNICNIEEN